MNQSPGRWNFFLVWAVVMSVACLWPEGLLSGSSGSGASPGLPGDVLSPWGDSRAQQGGFPSCAVIIRVTGLDPPRGVVRLALYDSRQSYESRSHPVRSAAVEVTDKQVTVKFDGLPPGDYAVMMYHDTNRNQRFDRLLGLPREQYGFSNNAVPGLGAPDFDRVRFRLKADRVTFLEIRAQ